MKELAAAGTTPGLLIHGKQRQPVRTGSGASQEQQVPKQAASPRAAPRGPARGVRLRVRTLSQGRLLKLECAKVPGLTQTCTAWSPRHLSAQERTRWTRCLRDGTQA